MKIKHYLFLALGLLLLEGCVTSIWTGATLLYDRHNVYKKTDDFSLGVKVNQLLFQDNLLRSRGCLVDVTVFNQAVLVAGHVPTMHLKKVLRQRLRKLEGYRYLYDYVVVDPRLGDQTISDIWITTKIRSHIFSNASIDPNVFKVVTVDGIVYLMGEAKREQAQKVIHIASNTDSVQKVISLIRYYQLN